MTDLPRDADVALERAKARARREARALTSAPPPEPVRGGRHVTIVHCCPPFPDDVVPATHPGGASRDVRPALLDKHVPFA